jgi:hypothetical protein
MKQKNHEGVGSIKINPKENEKKKKTINKKYIGQKIARFISWKNHENGRTMRFLK